MLTTDPFAARAELSGEHVALVDTATGVERTYAELHDRAARLAEHLRIEAGVAPGDRVAVLAHNGPEMIELLVACARIGALLVPLNWRLAAPELETIVADSRPRLLIADDANVETAVEVSRRSGVPLSLVIRRAAGDPAAAPGDGVNPARAAGADPGGSAAADAGGPAASPATYEDAIAAADPLRDPRWPGEGDAWYLLFTSGTTGRPKGVIQTPRMALANYVNIGVPIDLTSADATCNVLPMFHTGGLNLYTMPTLLVGATALVTRAFEPGHVLDVLEQRATVMFGVPAVYQMLADHPRVADADLARVRSWACGGAPLPVPLIERYGARGITIRQGFGMTETGPTVFLIDEANALAKAGSVGKPQLLAEVRIVDRDRRDVPDGEAGELLVRGPGVTPGYWERPDATDEAFAPGGWLHSGDVARCDADGYYTIVDRWKDMYISGGENVFPGEVELVLHAHPQVAEAAVVGVPDERWGEVGKAVLVPAGGDVDVDDVLAHCRAHLASYKVPKHVETIAELPRNAAGKVAKQELSGAPAGEQA